VLVVVLGEDSEDSSRRAARTTALLVAHDYSEALWLANQVAVNGYGTFQWAPRER
jgi:ABC-type proline/glycine betaine transport system ATPase subunit